jgi:Lambda phage tail tape-measure protein (Tape_meas_lam_C)
MYIAALDEVKRAQEEVNKNFSLGFGEGLREFAVEATNVRNQAKDLAKGIAGDISGELKKALKGGGVDIAEMISSIGGRFLDMAVDNFVGSIAKNLGGMFDDNANDPVARAKKIVDMQQDAYLMTVQGVQSAGDSFVVALKAAFDKLVSDVAMINGNPDANYLPGAVTRSPLPPAAGQAAKQDRLTSSVDAAIERRIDAAFAGQKLVIGAGFSNKVDARLLNILDEAAKNTALKVEAISGYRSGDPRFHGKGLATDIRLSDPASGKVFGNYQNGPDFRIYEQFAQQAKLAQMKLYPELADKFRWGGYFGGARGRYGALDTMHFDLGGSAMGGGSWANGLNQKQRDYFPDAKSVGMNMQQLQQQLTQVATASQTAVTATQNVAQAYQATGTSAATASTASNQAAQAVQTLASNATNASDQIHAAGTNIASAGQAAATAGQQAGAQGTTGLSDFAQGISGLLGPLNQVVPGLGSFAQMVLQLLSSLGSGGGVSGGGLLGGLLSMFGFANGGIMGPGGALPLRTYSRGGIANSPQLALFGEGRKNEAYVPLPDNRTIPVTLHGNGGGGGVSVGEIKIDVQMNGSSGNRDQDQKHAQNTVSMIDKMLDDKMSQWFLRQSANGGMVNQAQKG